jgi:hypothetical protein
MAISTPPMMTALAEQAVGDQAAEDRQKSNPCRS